MDYVIVCSIFFILGYVAGKILAKMHRFCMLFWSLMLMPILYNHPNRNLLIVTVAFILGVAKGYNLFPNFCEMLEELKISIQLFFAQRKQFARNTRQDNLREQERQNRAKAEELNRKEQELHRQAEEIKRHRRQAEEELKKAREQPEPANYPRTLQEAFEVLGTRSGLTLEDYKMIWKQEVLKYHPDRTAGLGERLQKQAEEEMKRINRAWDIIKNKLK